jgi:flagellar biosynthesis/type III secretory pathway M-ring protein FliF/YscJ
MANSKFNLSKGEEKKSSKFNLTKEEAPVTTTKSTQPTKKFKWWLWLLLLALVVIVIILCVKNCPFNFNNDKDTGAKPGIEEPGKASEEESQGTGVEGIGGVAPGSDEAESTSEQNGNKTPLQGSIEEKAKQVIRGDFGNGAERINKLGSEYNAVQSKVNELYRNGNTNY